MSPGQEPGSVSGSVTYAMSGICIPYAHVTIVNASNSSIKYASQATDADGYYHFYPVNATNSGKAYRLFVQTHDKEKYSDSFAVGPGVDCSVDALIYTQNYPTPTPAPQANLGNLSGTVTDADTHNGVQGVRISIVNTLNPDFTYNSTYTDSQGYYLFTYVEGIIPPGYRLYMEKTGYISAYSESFTLDTHSVVTNLSIRQSPVNITRVENEFNLSATTTATVKPAVPTVTPVSSTDPISTPARETATPIPAPGFGVFVAIVGLGAAIAWAVRLGK